jgi:DNA-binding transcriptional LysR family regulator
MIGGMAELQWDDLRVFLAMARAASVQEAAAQLGVDRSTVGRRVAALERALGARLFSRTRDGLRPTAVAERLRPRAAAVEAEVQSLRGAAAAGEGRPAGTVRIATTEALAALLVESGLLGVMDQAPDLRIDLATGNRPIDLGRGEADLAVRATRVDQPSLRVRCLARVPVGLYASPGYLLSRGRPSARGGLSGHDLLLPSGELARMPEARWLSARKKARVVLRSNSMPALVAAAAAGRGLVPLGLGWGDAHPGLERALILESVPPRTLWLVTREGEERPAVRLVANRVAAIFARG